MKLLGREIISNKQAIAIANNIRAMLRELEKLSIKYMLDIVLDEEKEYIFVKINQSKKDKIFFL